MLRKTKLAFLLLLGGGIAIGVGAVMFALSSDPPLLTNRARRVAPLPSPDASCEWLSDHEVVIYNSSQPVTRMDTRTGTRVVLEAFHKRVGKRKYFGDLAISPDGTRALWGNGDGTNHRATSVLLNGSSLIKRGPKWGEVWHNGSDMLWMRNSSQWLQVLKVDQGFDGGGVCTFDAIIEGVDTPGIKRRIPLGRLNAITGYGFSDLHLLGWVSAGRVLATDYFFVNNHGSQPQRRIDFVEFNVDGGPVALRMYVISLPKAGEMLYDGDGGLSIDEEVALTPRGDRLAWIVHTRAEQPSLLKWLARWIPSLTKSPTLRTELRTSLPDGRDFKVIGYLEPDIDVSVYHWHDKNTPYDLRWNPDGRHVSFIYKAALWTIATE